MDVNGKWLRYTVKYGLGNVLAILMAGAFGMFAQFVLKENSKREAKYQELLTTTIVGLSESVRNQTALIIAHDERAKSYIQSRSSLDDRVDQVLSEMTAYMRSGVRR